MPSRRPLTVEGARQFYNIVADVEDTIEGLLAEVEAGRASFATLHEGLKRLAQDLTRKLDALAPLTWAQADRLQGIHAELPADPGPCS